MKQLMILALWAGVFVVTLQFTACIKLPGSNGSQATNGQHTQVTPSETPSEAPPVWTDLLTHQGNQGAFVYTLDEANIGQNGKIVSFKLRKRTQSQLEDGKQLDSISWYESDCANDQIRVLKSHNLANDNVVDFVQMGTAQWLSPDKFQPHREIHDAVCKKYAR